MEMNGNNHDKTSKRRLFIFTENVYYCWPGLEFNYHILYRPSCGAWFQRRVCRSLSGQ